MHVGTERDIFKSLIAKILLQVVSTIQVKVNSSKSLTRFGFGLHHYIKKKKPNKKKRHSLVMWT